MTTSTIPQANNVEMLATLLHSLTTGETVDIAPRHRAYYLSALKHLELVDSEGFPTPAGLDGSNTTIADAMAKSFVVEWYRAGTFDVNAEASGLGGETVARRALTAKAWSEFVKAHGHVEVKRHLNAIVANYRIGRQVHTSNLCPNCYIALPAAQVTECGYCGQEL